MASARIILTGKVKKIGELKKAGNISYNKFAICNSRKEKTGEMAFDWYNCTVFGKGAENLGKYTVDGDNVLVIGRLEQREYTKQDGSKGFSVNVIVESLEKTTPREDEQTQRFNQPSGQQKQSIPGLEEIPF